MILIKVTHDNTQGRVLAQDLNTCECICEVAQAPECEHEVVGDIPADFMQLLYVGTFGKYLDIATIEQIDIIKASLTDEEFAEIGTIKELKQMKQMKDLTNDIDALALRILQKEGVL